MAYHKKTGNYYKVLGTVIDATNGREHHELMVLYERDGILYVRKKSEFLEKFTVVEELELPKEADRE